MEAGQRGGVFVLEYADGGVKVRNHLGWHCLTSRSVIGSKEDKQRRSHMPNITFDGPGIEDNRKVLLT